MTQTTASPTLPPQQQDWIATKSPWQTVSVWLISLAIHVGILLLTLAVLLSGYGRSLRPGDGNFRDVGIYVKQTNNFVNQNQDANQTENETQFSPTTNQLSQTPSEIDANPPVDTTVPSVSKPIVGINSGTASALPGNPLELVRPNGLRGSQAAMDLGKGETSFLGVRDKAQRFVYLIDASGSMANYNAIRIAKAELIASLELLGPTQQFGVIFYNQRSHVMKVRGDQKGSLYWGNDLNRTAAEQFIRGIRPDLGTDHLPAIKKALAMNPEVLYFLTDAGEPQLDANERNEITRLNNGRTRIHCIEFGIGNELKGIEGNFIKKLARQNNGTYRYRNVRKFGRR